ncbi:MAG: hypothetical protein ABSA44_13565 [Bacteroidota bacterium]|jgi:excinuclease UvrABC nuclease subunit
MPDQKEVQKAVDAFMSKLKVVPFINKDSITIEQAKDKSFLSHKVWSDNPGIYLFFGKGQIKYVGRATRTTGLKNRIHEQATAFGDPNWDVVINNSDSTVSVIYFQPDDWYWVASLEVFLIEIFRPHLVNKRRA